MSNEVTSKKTSSRNIVSSIFKYGNAIQDVVDLVDHKSSSDFYLPDEATKEKKVESVLSTIFEVLGAAFKKWFK